MEVECDLVPAKIWKMASLHWTRFMTPHNHDTETAEKGKKRLGARQKSVAINSKKETNHPLLCGVCAMNQAIGNFDRSSPMGMNLHRYKICYENIFFEKCQACLLVRNIVMVVCDCSFR